MMTLGNMRENGVRSLDLGTNHSGWRLEFRDPGAPPSRKAAQYCVGFAERGPHTVQECGPFLMFRRFQEPASP